MNLKPTLLAVGLAVACGGLAIAPAALAADGTVTINGKVLNATCSVGGSPAGATVTLPDVAKSLLATSGSTAGKTAFTIALTGCPTTPTGVNVGLQFFSGQDTAAGAAANGQLANTTGGTYATNVDVQLLDSTGTTAVQIASAAPTDNTGVTDSTVVPGTGAVSLSYSAQYYATGVATAGLVAATTQFVVNYQ
jgi:major type 1 subunit fimbrin (pilin)